MAKKNSGSGVQVKAHMRNGKMVKAYTRGGGSSGIAKLNPIKGLKFSPPKTLSGMRSAVGGTRIKKTLKKESTGSFGVVGQNKNFSAYKHWNSGKNKPLKEPIKRSDASISARKKLSNLPAGTKFNYTMAKTLLQNSGGNSTRGRRRRF